MKPTKGPWRSVASQHSSDPIFILAGEEGAPVLHVATIAHTVGDIPALERKANAQAIAALPDLIEALQAALRCKSIGMTDHVTGETFICLIVEALEKAGIE